uniref:Putative product n=1 Tax=Xenopsylla cheopis TaxID=163159 RepID=A0A6M2DVG4_XENCH
MSSVLFHLYNFVFLFLHHAMVAISLCLLPQFSSWLPLPVVDLLHFTSTLACTLALLKCLSVHLSVYYYH